MNSVRQRLRDDCKTGECITIIWVFNYYCSPDNILTCHSEQSPDIEMSCCSLSEDIPDIEMLITIQNLEPDLGYQNRARPGPISKCYSFPIIFETFLLIHACSYFLAVRKPNLSVTRESWTLKLNRRQGNASNPRYFRSPLGKSRKISEFKYPRESEISSERAARKYNSEGEPARKYNSERGPLGKRSESHLFS